MTTITMMTKTTTMKNTATIMVMVGVMGIDVMMMVVMMMTTMTAMMMMMTTTMN